MSAWYPFAGMRRQRHGDAVRAPVPLHRLQFPVIIAQDTPRGVRYCTWFDWPGMSPDIAKADPCSNLRTLRAALDLLAWYKGYTKLHVIPAPATLRG